MNIYDMNDDEMAMFVCRIEEFKQQCLKKKDQVSKRIEERVAGAVASGKKVTKVKLSPEYLFIFAGNTSFYGKVHYQCGEILTERGLGNCYGTDEVQYSDIELEYES